MPGGCPIAPHDMQGRGHIHARAKRTLRSLSSMNREMYSGARLDRLMKCSNALFNAFWNDFSLLNDAAINLPQDTRPGDSETHRSLEY